LSTAVDFLHRGAVGLQNIVGQTAQVRERRDGRAESTDSDVESGLPDLKQQEANPLDVMRAGGLRYFKLHRRRG
jgi:hypothetical protein